MDFEYSTIDKALEDLRAGKVILVTDDPERENEGDMICAAEFATTENVNFMASYAKGLICMPMAPEYTDTLHLPHISIEKAIKYHSPKELIPYCDYSEFYKLWPKMVKEYVSFLEENHLDHKFDI